MAHDDSSQQRARVKSPNRDQLVLRQSDLEDLVGDDHPVRAVWAFVEGLDLSPLYAEVKAVDGHVGRPATDPALLLALWLYATLDGVGSARALERLCESHDAYRWLCGGVGVNRQTLSEFRVGNEAFLDRLLTRSVASLLNAELVTMRRVAQDGMRTRASAGAASFRRRTRLEQFLAEAQTQVEALKAELNADPAAANRRRDAARQRAAAERLARVKKALAELEAVEAAKKKQDEKEKARVSTTDSEARVMKMADGGWRPAYNVQFATDTGSMVIVGVDVTNKGSDLGELAPMVEQLHDRYGRRPDEVLVDGGFTKLTDIDQVAAHGCTVYAPAMTPRGKDGRDPHVPLPTDTPAIAAWRKRMGTDTAKDIYKERAATAECVNAQARNRGLRQFLVRGLARVRSIALLFAIAHNLQRWRVLSAAEA